jgi:hypothetical protein
VVIGRELGLGAEGDEEGGEPLEGLVVLPAVVLALDVVYPEEVVFDQEGRFVHQWLIQFRSRIYLLNSPFPMNSQIVLNELDCFSSRASNSRFWFFASFSKVCFRSIIFLLI